MCSINLNECKQYFRIPYTHIRNLCSHGKEILVLLFGAVADIIHCENSGEVVTSESYIHGTGSKQTSITSLRAC